MVGMGKEDSSILAYMLFVVKTGEIYAGDEVFLLD
jgi:hypothetical protein